ncbi:hypothetical protein EOM82_05265 [bacterium]|nr:hypothetical protein [bacterium]
MNYLGKGNLIGYKTYTKDGKQKHIYNVLNGNKDSKTGLYSECEYITIVQDEQTLIDIKPQNVSFEVACTNFGGKIQNRYMNLKPLS